LNAIHHHNDILITGVCLSCYPSHHQTNQPQQHIAFNNSQSSNVSLPNSPFKMNPNHQQQHHQNNSPQVSSSHNSGQHANNNTNSSPSKLRDGIGLNTHSGLGSQQAQSSPSLRERRGEKDGGGGRESRTAYLELPFQASSSSSSRIEISPYTTPPRMLHGSRSVNNAQSPSSGHSKPTSASSNHPSSNTTTPTTLHSRQHAHIAPSSPSLASGASNSSKHALVSDSCWYCLTCLPSCEIVSPRMLITFCKILSYGYGYKNSQGTVRRRVHFI
jgi:hypothetical protein